MIIEKKNLFESLNSLVKPREEENGVIVRRGVLLTKDGAFLVHYTDDLKTLYTMLDCRYIDIVTRSVNRKQFDFVVDDEGLMKEYNHLQAISSERQERLFGNILIAGLADDDGNLTDLSAMDLCRIAQNIFGGILIYDLY